MGLHADTLNKLVMTVGKPGLGELFLGLDSTTLNKSVLTMGEPGPDPGELFSETIDLTLMKARTPTAEAVRGIKIWF